MPSSTISRPASIQCPCQYKRRQIQKTAKTQELGRPLKKTGSSSAHAAPDPGAAAQLSSLQAKLLQLEKELKATKEGKQGGASPLVAAEGLPSSGGQEGGKDIWDRLQARISDNAQLLAQAFKKCVRMHACYMLGC